MSGEKEESEKAGSSAVSIQYPFMKHLVPHMQDIWTIVGVGGCPAVVAQWQSIGGSRQRCPGFAPGDCWPFNFPLFWPIIQLLIVMHLI